MFLSTSTNAATECGANTFFISAIALVLAFACFKAISESGYNKESYFVAQSIDLNDWW